MMDSIASCRVMPVRARVFLFPVVLLLAAALVQVADAVLITETSLNPPLTILYRTGLFIETKVADFDLNEEVLEGWSNAVNTPVILKAVEPEVIRYTLPSLMQSSVAADVVAWQGIVTIMDDCANLTDLAVAGDWLNRFPRSLINQLRHPITGAFLGVPDRYTFWGIWYKVSVIAGLPTNVTSRFPPRTWDELILLCEALRVTYPNMAPVGIGMVNSWQGMAWWSMIAQRLGGNKWWQSFLRGEIDATNDTVMARSWQRCQQIRSFMPHPLTSLSKLNYTGTVLTWLTGGLSALFLSPGTASIGISLAGKNASDYDFFPFPYEPSVNDGTEFVTSSLFAVNRHAKNPNMARAYIEFISTDTYAQGFVGGLRGFAPGQLAARSHITNPVQRKGFALLDNATTLLNSVDSDLPLWSDRALPTFHAFFTGSLNDLDEAARQLEVVRQEVQLSSTAVPVLKPSGGAVPLGTRLRFLVDTANATLFYSLTSISANADYERYYPVPDSLELELPSTPGVWRIHTYARGDKQRLRPSKIVEHVYTVGRVAPQLAPGTAVRLVVQFDQLGNGAVISLLVSMLCGWQTLIMLDSANRGVDARRKWTVAASVTALIGAWASHLLIHSSLATSQGSTPYFGLPLLLSSLIPMVVFGMAGWLRAVCIWNQQNTWVRAKSEADMEALAERGLDDISAKYAKSVELAQGRFAGCKRFWYVMVRRQSQHLIVPTMLCCVGNGLSRVMIGYSLLLPLERPFQPVAALVSLLLDAVPLFLATCIYPMHLTINPVGRIFVFCVLFALGNVPCGMYPATSLFEWSYAGATSSSVLAYAPLPTAVDYLSPGLVYSIALALTFAIVLPGVVLVPFAMGLTVQSHGAMLKRQGDDLVILAKKLRESRVEQVEYLRRYYAASVRLLVASSLNAPVDGHDVFEKQVDHLPQLASYMETSTASSFVHGVVVAAKDTDPRQWLMDPLTCAVIKLSTQRHAVGNPAHMDFLLAVSYLATLVNSNRCLVQCSVQPGATPHVTLIAVARRITDTFTSVRARRRLHVSDDLCATVSDAVSRICSGLGRSDDESLPATVELQEKLPAAFEPLVVAVKARLWANEVKFLMSKKPATCHFLNTLVRCGVAFSTSRVATATGALQRLEPESYLASSAVPLNAERRASYVVSEVSARPQRESSADDDADTPTGSGSGRTANTPLPGTVRIS